MAVGRSSATMGAQPPMRSRRRSAVPQLVLAAAGFLCLLYFFAFRGAEDHAAKGCVDLRNDCAELLEQGKCKADRVMMKAKCKRTCGMCGDEHANCIDSHESCPEWAMGGECKTNARFMVRKCQRSCGTCAACYQVTTNVPFLASQVFHVSDALQNGRPTYTAGQWTLAKQPGGAWAISDRAGRQHAAMQGPAADPTTAGAGGWLGLQHGAMAPSRVEVEEVGCDEARQSVPLPQQVAHASEEEPPKQGQDFWADYDVAHPKPGGPSYDYPEKPAFLYPEDVPGRPDIPFILMSYVPRVYYFPRFISDEEADDIVEEAAKLVKRSHVVSQKKGQSAEIIDPVRTSDGCWLDNRHKSVEAVRRRTLAVTGFNTSQTERMQVLRYKYGGKYNSHLDYYSAHGARTKEEQDEMWRLKWGKNWNRAATFYTFLSDTEEGGMTVLPRANGGPAPRSMTDCSKGLRVQPKKGAAVLFYDMKPNYEYDEYSLHGACPVVKGVKWGAPQWLHVKVREEGDGRSEW